VIEWLPEVSAVVERVATPESFKVAVPKDVAPLRKVTVPVGIVGPEVVATVAAKVTLAPRAAVAGPDSAVVVERRDDEFTSTDTVATLGARLALPL